jgi:glycosyltransferase involved in cell wall biosynthesis
MSVKIFGIYLAYAPSLDLRHEGLGRYLAAFLKGTESRDDVKFVLVCPSWSRKGLEELFSSEGVGNRNFEVVSPPKVPIILRAYEAYLARKQRVRRPSIAKRLLKNAFHLKNLAVARFEDKLVNASSIIGLMLAGVEVLALILISLPFLPVVVLMFLLFFGFQLPKKVTKLHRFYSRFLLRFSKVVGKPKDDAFVLRVYRGLERVESDRMLKLIDKMPEVRAWYCPTAFWPAFNRIEKPRLICVPDVVLSDFPIGFSQVGGDRFLQVFDRVEDTIRNGSHFVTYSDAVKWETLVDRYGISSRAVRVIHHAPNRLNEWVTVSGFSDVEETSRDYCETLFLRALKKANNYSYASTFKNSSLKFYFYASQFRPNKNLLSLLMAYDYLIKNNLTGHKLILTGNAGGMPEVAHFIKERHLENDVMCLHGLSVQELAACYKLADLAVNPSLSEGGCPFTFTEALSVSTPVVMARISVTEEVLSDPELQEVTFFDPYDWRDIASRIQWATANRDNLLLVQSKGYCLLAERTWTDVVNEHIDALDDISKAEGEQVTV